MADDDLAPEPTNGDAEYRDAGFSTFILAGNPHLEEALRIGQEVLPLVQGKRADIHELKARA